MSDRDRLAAALDAINELERWYPDQSLGHQHAHTIRAALARPAEPAEGLTEAWAEAEAVLPEGYDLGGVIQRRRDGTGWQAIAMRLSEAEGYPDAANIEGDQAPTPAAALLALAARLREPT